MTNETEAIKESAKAVKAVAETATKALTVAEKAGGYIAGVVGQLPHNVVGIANDYFAQVRIRCADKFERKTKAILAGRNIPEMRELSPSVGVPLIQAAVDEDRDELAELWAAMMANALDPSRMVPRRGLVEVLKRLEGSDVLV